MTNILVVDDHPFFLHGFSQYLENGYDFTVETALSVDEAIAKLDSVRPDLAMFDAGRWRPAGVTAHALTLSRYSCDVPDGPC
jgi:DNA-binding NarL/FixJ family response regulator